MAGHSKWAQIKRKKAANDLKKGKIVSKYLRLIAAAARAGGSTDPAANPSLRNLIEAARDADVPSDNIERLLKRLSGGEEEGAQYEEVVYEGYAPGGVAVIVQALSDNRNRTASEVRHIFNKHGGSLGATGSVSWQFERRGYIWISPNTEAAQEAAIEAGAVDLQEGEGGIEVYTDPQEVYAVASALKARGFKPENTEITMVPQNTVSLSQAEAEKVLKMVEALEELDDVQNVYTNLNLENVSVEA
ncbi:MAG: YebC/PmpR family DNA-binding transcriptional regulator [Meiothermus sp.]|uniref:YebC/PmpR family DNA-binding transcriptional regulator n=1 Tax=Meiothermus sp. TaxID=1955249 RepID=UPI0025CDCFA8|nr:YebC/PmpR family DNA-binding transcriptional regulator [Meiothermus sp.]MCS7057923.1 YebC/PmpR family DNA-binding transcriptional regulator [Meiothermus sp.]MCS7194201.1 YebC/PmpR family DNA-binding transcriptional regulator [Meiothermus sp.]MDW8090062.1 YebC/PmpR family DNA-binding transcriptional regulator [Meiothermus sp.]